MKIGLTMGDPLGIGPEVLLKALANGEAWQGGPFLGEHCVERVIYGVGGCLDAAPGPSPLWDSRTHLVEVAGGAGAATALPSSWSGTGWGTPAQRALGEVVAGEMAFACLEKATGDLVAGKIDALVTGPVHKAHISQAIGRPFTGQTEYLAGRFGKGEEQVVMMLAGPVFRVALATTHLPLRDVAASLNRSLLTTRLLVLAKSLKQEWGISHPRIGVCALNPHGGESGLFGDEEQRVILPAITEVAAMGWQVEGPFPADAFIPGAIRGGWDAVFAMYHDQGLIPLKAFHYRDAANITLGLGGIRCSPDHGTACDIAGKGVADPGSMMRAVTTAVQLVVAKRKSPVDDGQRVDLPSVVAERRSPAL